MTEIEQQQRELREDLKQRGITDVAVLDAIEQTRRDLFVPEPLRQAAYDDSALPIGEGQTISQPYMVGLMTQALAPKREHSVLEIGTGSGYQTAILARLARRVVTIERIEKLSRSAESILADMGLNNVKFIVGDGTLGHPECGPYDGVLVAAGAPAIPEPLYEQLAPGGRLVVPVGDEQLQELVLLEKTDVGPKKTPLCGCRFVRLIGEAGWAPVE